VRAAGLAPLAAALGAGAGIEWIEYDGAGVTVAVADLVVGVVLVVGGIVAGRRRPASRSGALMAAAGAAWFAGTLVPVAVFWHRAVLAHLFLSYPTGRLRGRVVQAVVVVAYVYAAIPAVAADDAATLAFAVLVGLTAVVRYRRASGPARKAGAAALASALAFAGVLAVVSVEHLAGAASAGSLVLLYDAVIVASASVLLLDLVTGRWVDAAVTDLVVDLGARQRPDALRDRLARAVGDPSLVVGYWLPERSAYVDEAGAPVVPPSGDDPGRRATEITDGPVRLAVLVHDPATLDDPTLLAAVVSATRLAVSNGRLQADIGSRVADLTASRRRIVEANDAQHQRLAHELREGTERRLARVAELLADARGEAGEPASTTLARLADELDDARTELQDLAHGMHPARLDDGGLAAALPALAARAPVPVALSAAVPRLPRDVEAAVYFVCCEGLTNVAKHAGANHVYVDVSAHAGRVVARIADDGAGGADPTGSGLRGLADRVAAVGGRLVVQSPAGGGTTLVASIPTA
jgi:signal transduction histidine kinase